MARAPDPKADQARAMYQEGRALVEIAKALNVPAGTVRRWKSTYKWDSKRSDKNSERSESKANVRKTKKAIAEKAAEKVLENLELTDKQQLFCVLVAFGDNATTAYQKAYGCSYQTAMTNASRMLRNAKIRDEVQRLKKERFAAQLFDDHDIFQWHLDVAQASITDFVTFGRERVQVMGAFGPVVDKETGDPVTKEINYVKFKESSDVNGHVIKKVRLGKDGASIELYSAADAMAWLADHMGLGTDAQQTLAQTIMGAYQKQQGGEADDDADRDG